MYRQSSKGNPWHDSRGRFTSNGSTGKQAPVKWSSFDDVQDVTKLKKKDAAELDRKQTDKHMKDGKRFYHNKSIQREKNAIALSSIELSKGLTHEKRKAEYNKAKAKFAKENAVALRKAKENGGQIITFRVGNSNKLAFQIVESKRVTYKDGLGFGADKSVTRNTSSSMKLFHGFTVDFNNDKEIRSCKMNATPDEVTKSLEQFCKKHGKVISQGKVHLHVTRDFKNRVTFAPSYYFETEKEAKAYAKQMGGTYNIVSHDDGSQA